MQREIHEDEND